MTARQPRANFSGHSESRPRYGLAPCRERLMLDAQSPDYPVIIPTEPIGSIPRPLRLIEAFTVVDSADPMLDPLYEEAIRDTIAQFEVTGSPVITDGEQRKYHNFGTYCVDGLSNLAPDGFKLPLSLVILVAGHASRVVLFVIAATRIAFSILPGVLRNDL